MAQPRGSAQRRIGDYDKTFGEGLDELDGKEVFVHSFSLGERDMTRDGETVKRPFTLIEISDAADSPTATYHTWSESIAEKLSAIPKEELPLAAKFTKVRTGAGFEVWDVK